MAMVCPQCKGSFEQSLHCPTCGVHLLYQTRLPRRDSQTAGPGGQWLQTSVGRMAAGMLLAQGLAYSLHLLCNAGLQVTAAPAEQTVWSTLYGLVLLQLLQAVSLLAGGALAGAGQRRPAGLGAAVGAVHGSLFLLVQRLQGGPQVTEVALYGQPLLHVALGSLGAVLGASIWRPLPVLAMPDFETERQTKTVRTRSLTLAALRGPVAWGRVFAGIVIVTAGFLWGRNLLSVVMDASQGTLKINDRLQAQLVTWEIIGLVTLLGAAIAGSTTLNGLKQGLCVGIGASILLIGNHLGGKNVFLSQMVLTTTSILGLTIAGGWFGGQLFPPVHSVHQRHRVRSPV
jgi:hypothetical protein